MFFYILFIVILIVVYFISIKNNYLELFNNNDCNIPTDYKTSFQDNPKGGICVGNEYSVYQDSRVSIYTIPTVVSKAFEPIPSILPPFIDSRYATPQTSTTPYNKVDSLIANNYYVFKTPGSNCLSVPNDEQGDVESQIISKCPDDKGITDNNNSKSIYYYTDSGQLKRKNSGLCLSTKYPRNTNENTNVGEHPCKGTPNEQWIYSNGLLRPYNAQNMCLYFNNYPHDGITGDVVGSITRLTPCPGNKNSRIDFDNQRWSIYNVNHSSLFIQQ